MDRLISERLLKTRLSTGESRPKEITSELIKDIFTVIDSIPSAYKGMTNGEVIKVVFPDIPRTLEWHIQNVTDYDWWNAPYKGEQERSDKE